uniref:DUF19 domain-containing protein n=1 Tax=Parascaris univalens TaxID=6257 RepID=A0A915BJ36_PARUN
AFQPHPLAVIRQPKQIDEACKEFQVFSNCRANVNCRPLWADGMSAMLEFACGQGYNTFVQVRQCVRKMTTREDIRECVSVFSRGAPQLACQSSNTLLSCALPVISEKCGTVAAQFITDYVDRFAKAINPSCKITAKSNEGAISGYNCTIEEQQVIQHCAAPLNELSSRIDELFEGGLQAFLANVKNLAPVFAQGCNLTVEFRECTKPLLMHSSRCVVSSCLIRAGEGICDQPDTAKAIDENLSCVFKQASNMEFGKCLRTTIATLKTFTLTALRTVLPRFISCIETIVIKQCGQTPLHLLKAISSSDICPLEIMSSQRPNNAPLASSISVCTPEMRTKHIACTGDFFHKYRMLPIAIINDASDISQLCEKVDAISTCSLRACEENSASALRSMLQLMCARKVQFEKHVMCLASVASSEQGAKCSTAFLTSTAENRCIALSSNAECAAPLINEACGSEALTLSFDAMNQYAEQLNSSCSISVPSVSLSTGCSEADLVEYLECETFIDPFAFNPLSFIRNATYFDEFCASSIRYKQCVTNMTCKFEPISSSNIALFETVCSNTDIRPHIECLTHYVRNGDGQKCLEAYSRIDLLAKDAPHKLCSALSAVLSCAAESIERECGVEALKKVHAVDSLWSQHFHAGCIIRINSISKESSQKPVVDFSSDAKSTEIGQEMPTEGDVGVVQNETANPEPSPEPDSSPESRSFSVPPASQPEPEPKSPTNNDGQQVSGSEIESKPQPTGANNEATPEPIPEPTTQSESSPSAEPKEEMRPNSEPEPTNTTNNRTKGCERSNPSAILFSVFAVFVLRI